MPPEESSKSFHRVASTMGFDDIVLGKGEPALNRAQYALQRSPEVKKMKAHMFQLAKVERERNFASRYHTIQEHPDEEDVEVWNEEQWYNDWQREKELAGRQAPAERRLLELAGRQRPLERKRQIIAVLVVVELSTER